MDKRILRKTLCLLTIWVFLLSQLSYAGLYEGRLDIPSSQDMPSWEGSSGWRNPKVEPLYDPQQIEPTLPLSNGEEGDSDGIWGWFKKHIIEPVVNFFTARKAPPQATPTPTPIPEAEIAQIKVVMKDFISEDPDARYFAYKKAVDICNRDEWAIDLFSKILINGEEEEGILSGIAYVFGEIKTYAPFIKVEGVLIRTLWSKQYLSVRFASSQSLEKRSDIVGLKEVVRAKIDDNWLFNPSLEQLNSPDSLRRIEATLYLGSLGDHRAIPTLEKVAASDENEQVRQAAKEALKKIK